MDKNNAKENNNDNNVNTSGSKANPSSEIGHQIINDRNYYCALTNYIVSPIIIFIVAYIGYQQKIADCILSYAIAAQTVVLTIVEIKHFLQTRLRNQVNQAALPAKLKSQEFAFEFIFLGIRTSLYVSLFELFLLLKYQIDQLILICFFLAQFQSLAFKYFKANNMSRVFMAGQQVYTVIRIQMEINFTVYNTLISALYIIFILSYIDTKAKKREQQRIDLQTEKTKTENIMRLYQSILSIIPEGIAVINSDKKLLYANSTLKKILQSKNKNEIIQILMNLGNNNSGIPSGSVKQSFCEQQGESHVESILKKIQRDGKVSKDGGDNSESDDKEDDNMVDKKNSKEQILTHIIQKEKQCVDAKQKVCQPNTNNLLVQENHKKATSEVEQASENPKSMPSGKSQKEMPFSGLENAARKGLSSQTSIYELNNGRYFAENTVNKENNQQQQSQPQSQSQSLRGMNPRLNKDQISNKELITSNQLPTQEKVEQDNSKYVQKFPSQMTKESQVFCSREQITSSISHQSSHIKKSIRKDSRIVKFVKVQTSLTGNIMNKQYIVNSFLSQLLSFISIQENNKNMKVIKESGKNYIKFNLQSFDLLFIFTFSQQF